MNEFTSNRKRIAIFDYFVVPNNPAGGCNLRIVSGLSECYDFVVFAAAFDNPAPDRIQYVRVPAIKRPLALLFLSFHVSARLRYALYCLTNNARFDLKQAVESNYFVESISYVHFCHRAFLKKHRPNSVGTGLRRFLRLLDHKLHAIAEPWLLRRVQHIVVPSHGLANELSQEYPFTRDKIHIIANAVDVQQLTRPKGFDRNSIRSTISANSEDVVLVFVALGQFERKGLPILIDALSSLRMSQLKLAVVGGTEDSLDFYRQKAASNGIGEKVIFTGMQQDIRPYLWASDGFVLPSVYEVFPLVALEAAAAALPLITTQLYGLEEFVRDNENAVVVERSVAGLEKGIRRFLSMSALDRLRMGTRAQQDVQRYNPEAFIAAWQKFYQRTLME